MRSRIRVLALTATCVATFATRAHAHDITDPRVLVVVPGKDTLELRVNEMTPAAESAELRRRFDGDRSGRLDDSEQSDLASFLSIRATKNLAVEENGAALSLKTASRLLRNAGDKVDASDPLSIDVVLEARPAGVKEVRVVVRDFRADDHSIRVAVLASGVALEEASSGTLDAKRGLVTGVVLDRAHTLALRYGR